MEDTITGGRGVENVTDKGQNVCVCVCVRACVCTCPHTKEADRIALW